MDAVGPLGASIEVGGGGGEGEGDEEGKGEEEEDFGHLLFVLATFSTTSAFLCFFPTFCLGEVSRGYPSFLLNQTIHKFTSKNNKKKKKERSLTSKNVPSSEKQYLF